MDAILPFFIMELFDYGEQEEIEDANNDILFLFLQSFLARSQVPKIYTFAEEIIPNFNDYDFQRLSFVYQHIACAPGRTRAISQI